MTLPTISDLIARKALFVINHSGGKDSQAQLIAISQRVPLEQIVVVHAELPGVEWEGTIEKVYESSRAVGISDENIFVTRARKTFFEMVRHRGFWPAPKYRQCTSDLKRNPIEKAVRGILKDRGLSLVVNCMGLRAEESSSRAKQVALKLNAGNSKAGREWYDWLPIHSYKIGEVFETIARAGQTPHWAYAAGMSRLSCCFCIMSSQADLETAARLNPKLFDEYNALEREIDQTFLMPSKAQGRRFLNEVL